MQQETTLQLPQPNNELQLKQPSTTRLSPVSKQDMASIANRLDTDSEGAHRMATLEEAQAILSTSQPVLCSKSLATEIAGWIGKQMPKAANFGFELWLDDMARVLPGYPEVDVRLAFLDPVEGLRKTHKFLPDIPAVTKFLDDRRRRRGRILDNARKVVAYRESEDAKAAEPVETEDERRAMSRKLENLARSMRKLPAIELV